MTLKIRILIIVDLFLAWAAFYSGLLLRFGVLESHNELFHKPVFRSFLFAFVMVTVSYIFEMYGIEKQRNTRAVLTKIITVATVSFLLLSIIVFINPNWMIGRGVLAISLALFICYQLCWHVAFRMLFKLPYLTESIIVLGTGQFARRIGGLFESADVNQIFKGYLSCEECVQSGVSVPEKLIIGTTNELKEVVSREAITAIIVTEPECLETPHFQNLLLNCKLQGIDISDALTFFEKATGKLPLEYMNTNRLIYSTGFKRSPIIDTSKRVVDIILAVIGIVLTLPFLPLIALLVKLNSPGPILYRQIRVGHMEQHFFLYKFRSMGQNAESESGAVWAQENDSRVRPIGKFLRKSRLDEIPQLYNVLVGDMSFVGPRPERPEFVEKLEEAIPYYAKRHFLKPGITGWAQINHPYGASVEESFEKLRYDLYYFKNMNPLLDTIIFLKTLRVVLSQFGGR